LDELPHEDIAYYGDLARLPYGIKSREQIIRFSCENTEFLIGRGVKALVVACNSSASASLSVLKRTYPEIPVIDVIAPAAEKAVKFSFAQKIGVVGTQATIQTRAYERALKRLSRRVQVFAKACPLFVPLVEEGWLHGKITQEIVDTYLESLKARGIDTLILGCTHYPLLKGAIRRAMGPRVVLVDSAGPTVYHLKHRLKGLGLLSGRRERGRLKVFVSDIPRNFVSVGERFLGRRLTHVQSVPVQPLIKLS
jgi:glutamate racemase